MEASDKQAAKAKFFEGDSRNIDPETLNRETLDCLNEEELYEFEKKWKNDWLPTWRLGMLIPYNLLMGGLTFYYTINFKKFSKILFKPKKFGVFEILKYGTIQSLAFIAVYVPGTLAVTNLWHPIGYLRGLAQIKGKIIDNQLRFDDSMQDNFLFGMMEYFGLSKEFVEKAKKDLDIQKEELEKRGYFMKNEDDEYDDEETEPKEPKQKNENRIKSL